MPSGGDWTLQRQAAIMCYYCENISIDNNIFIRLDGNGIMLNNYNRNISITNNDMSWIGDTAIALWGDTTPFSFPNANTNTTMGWDGTQQTQPRNITIAHNFVRELGYMTKIYACVCVFFVCFFKQKARNLKK